MKRRTFLGSVGAVASLGALSFATREPVDSIHVRFWLSERAAEYDDVPKRVAEYLEFAFDFEFWSLETSYGGIVPVSIEDGADVTLRGEWPARVIGGSLGRTDLEPVSDVNLLVTDGAMDVAPTGYGFPHVASVGGAKHLAEIPPLDRTADPVPYTAPHRVMQVLVHEVGHALGLKHGHGVAYERGGAVVATPMLSAYAWDPDYEADSSSCGTVYPDTLDAGRELSYSFSPCARKELEEYAGGFTL